MSDRPTLEALIAKVSNTDNRAGTDKGTTHSYTDLYTQVLTPYRDTATRVLEIGVYSGASIWVWAEYFAQAQVTGMDIDMSKVVFGKDHERIRFLTADGTRTKGLIAAGGGDGVTGTVAYDVIIDDASHNPADQVETLRLFAPILAPGGVYVIEDINEKFAESVKTGVGAIAIREGLTMVWHDLRKNKGRFDDIVAVLYRPAAVV